MNRRVALDAYSRLLDKRREHGFSLVEVLVVVALLAIVGIIVVAAVINTTEANDNVGAATMTQRELLDTTSAVSRDISMSTGIVGAGDYYLIMNVNTDGVSQVVTYFYYSPDENKELSQDVIERMEAVGITEDDLPDFPAVIEIRENIDGTYVLRTLVPGFMERDGNPLFTYYDYENSVLSTSAVTGEIDGSIPDDKIASIERVEMRFAAQPTGRDKAMELATSVTPKSNETGNTVGSDTEVAGVNLASPVLTASLPPKTNETKLEWTRVEGATGYTLYRLNREQQLEQKVIGTFDRNTLSTTDPGLTWGETYIYFVVASGPLGNSNESNRAQVDAVPPAPVLTGEAVDRTNHLSWEHVNGVGPFATPANSPGTGYRVYRTGEDGETVFLASVQGTTYQDPNRNFGDRTFYTVVPYNRGGAGFYSNKLELLTRPPATTVSVDISEKSNTANISWEAAKNANTYTVYRMNRNSDSAVEVATTRNLSTMDPGLAWGEKYTYYVHSENSGGTSDRSNLAHDWTVPPAPKLSGSANGTNNILNWDEVNGVGSKAEAADRSYTGYRLYRVVNGQATKIYEGSALTYTDSRPNGSTTDYYVEPYNRGGTGFKSNEVRLVSPPVAPNVTVKDYDDGRDGSNQVLWNTPAGATRFDFQKNNGSIGNKGSATSLVDTNPGWDSINTYKVRACNAAGCSPWGSATGKQPPGTFSVSKLQQNRGDYTWMVGGHGSAGSRPSTSRNHQGDDKHKWWTSLQWGSSSEADVFAVNNRTKNGGLAREVSTSSRSVTENSLQENTLYRYTIDAKGFTSGMIRRVSVTLQTAPALPREVRSRFYNEGGSNGRVYSVFELTNGSAGHGSGGNGYKVHGNSAIVTGGGENQAGVSVQSIQGWRDWRGGTTFNSSKWNMRNSGNGRGAMLFYRGASVHQNGAHIPGVINTSKWPSFASSSGIHSELYAVSMRTYGSGVFPNTGFVPQQKPWGYYRNTSSMDGYYSTRNG